MESTTLNNDTTSAIDFVTSWDVLQVTEDNFMKEVRTYIAFKIATFINTYWAVILTPVGFIGNSLSFTVMMKPQNRKMSTCIYMAAISINDNLMMLMIVHHYFVSVLQLHKWYILECKIAAFVALFCLQNCTYLILAMTTDKYIAIRMPYKAALISTSKRAKIVAITLQYPTHFSF